jgi:hypothetical protein
MIDTNQGIVLVGEAAKSWVELQWFKIYIGCGIASLFFLIVIIFFISWAREWDRENS